MKNYSNPCVVGVGPRDGNTPPIAEPCLSGRPAVTALVLQGGAHLQTAPGTVLCDDADIGRVDAGADETGQVLVLDVPHLKNPKNIIREAGGTALYYPSRDPSQSAGP